MSIELLKAEQTALEEMAHDPLEIWVEGIESASAVLICDSLCKRGFCTHERANSTLARFTITDAGRHFLENAGHG